MRVIAFIQDERVARKILEHLGLVCRAPPRGVRRGGNPGQPALPFEGPGPDPDLASVHDDPDPFASV
jgi:hypothetical protein